MTTPVRRASVEELQDFLSKMDSNIANSKKATATMIKKSSISDEPQHSASAAVLFANNNRSHPLCWIQKAPPPSFLIDWFKAIGQEIVNSRYQYFLWNLANFQAELGISICQKIFWLIIPKCLPIFVVFIPSNFILILPLWKIFFEWWWIHQHIYDFVSTVFTIRYILHMELNISVWLHNTYLIITYV